MVEMRPEDREQRNADQRKPEIDRRNTQNPVGQDVFRPQSRKQRRQTQETGRRQTVDDCRPDMVLRRPCPLCQHRQGTFQIVDDGLQQFCPQRAVDYPVIHR